MADYKFVDATPPTRAGRGKSDYYAKMIAAFVKSGKPSVKVTETGRKPSTLQIGLAKAVKESDPAVPVRVRKSGDDVFLVRTDMDE
ncbi:MAG: hypothetical protein CVT67_03010 [Actinobacteria bacterium HGW-Actinobacteria-7]|jgi:hypothetical protein|nr:MAG: hypothetical protein CVT67_03010 [Actinobacteria bacterium HGW-Actinobacteria-7]